MTLAESLQIFEITSLQDQDENSLKRIYYRLAQKYHPDRGGTFEQFIKLREAYSYLKDAVNNPNFKEESATDFGKGFNDSNYDFHSQDFKQDQGNQEYNYTDLLSQLNAYKQAYEQAREHVIKYENVFNSQIRVINQTSQDLNTLFQTYDQKKAILEQVFQQEMSKVKAQYERKWWEYILPVNKITIDQFIARSNNLVEQYNQTMENYDDELMNEIIKVYQQNYQDIMSLLEF
ncbi:MAG: hypothetical protein OHK0017_12910 [Patescibacteria group bacterium]